MTRFLFPTAALLCALQIGVAEARELAVRQAQLIDFARPPSAHGEVTAVESAMREQLADAAIVLQPNFAGPRLSPLDHHRLFRAAPTGGTGNWSFRSPIFSYPKDIRNCELKAYRPSPILSRAAERRRQQLYPLVRRAACEANLPIGLMDALVMQESRYNPTAISPKGAFGLGQLMSATARQLGVDRYSLHGNLRGAARYLSWQLQEFGRVDLALAAYNAGPARVRKVQRVPRITETQNYVRKILTSWWIMESNHLPPMLAQASPLTSRTIWQGDFRRSAEEGAGE